MGCDKILGVAALGVASVLLALVAFDVPYFKSIYFLRIDLSGAVASTADANQTTPFVDLGVLGFCTNLQNGMGLQCSPAKIGYSLSEASKYINGTLPSILSNEVSVAAAALTKALVLHIVALVIALVAFAFALLALLGIPFLAECCADCFSGLAGATGLTVFIFDLAFFFIIRKRVNDTSGANSAAMGNAVWLTAAAMLLLFVTPILFLIGRCCGFATKVAYKPL
ncbi:actin cortical patch SUR7/pH-response regulator pali [Mycena sanguinolenta]|nr:actin cortical patch SUR7/pH-response regulator pali [Mycena sanguinolenta]